ncbi:DUF536 domain-containing protein [Holzapfeliella sp. JNUCC 80]
MKTVRELSQEIGVSRQAINNLLKSEKKLKKYVKKVKGANQIDEGGQELIKQHFKTSKQANKKYSKQAYDNFQTSGQQVSDKEQTTFQQVDTVSQEVLTMLHQEMKDKNEQIKNLQKLLDQQQQLTLQSNSNLSEVKKEVDTEKQEKRQALELLESYKQDVDKLKASSQQVSDNEQEQQESKPWWKFWK